MTETEKTLMTNVGYVNDLRAVLSKAMVDHDVRIEVRTLIVGSGLTIDEVTQLEDGTIVLYVGLNAGNN